MELVAAGLELSRFEGSSHSSTKMLPTKMLEEDSAKNDDVPPHKNDVISEKIMTNR